MCVKEILWIVKWYKGQEVVDIGFVIKLVLFVSLFDEVKVFVYMMIDKLCLIIVVLKGILCDGEGLSIVEGVVMELKVFGYYNCIQFYGCEGYIVFCEGCVLSWKVV